MTNSLIKKYNVAGPRYTSYPTVPYWDRDTFSLKNWKTSATKSFSESNIKEGISLYVHLPFCESMCTFCGCSKRITKQHRVEDTYINAILREWRLYLDLFNARPVIKELHLGGGTPTFFSPKNLNRLVTGVLSSANLAPHYIFSFEGHPNNTSDAHLQALYELGFKRVSYGVQDYNEKVQKAIHRIQPFKQVQQATEMARKIGYSSVGHDLIYGLPFQTLEDIKNSILKTQTLLPDRIAFYSYAHVPWLKGNGQRGFRDTDLPTANLKNKQYNLGKKLLTDIGYVEIGMDHFALPSDPLYQSMNEGHLHRNFMGYTPSKTQMTIGLGVSAISDSWYSFAQNEKNIEAYYHLLNADILPVYRGHLLNDKDLIIRKHILNLMCQFKTAWPDKSLHFKELPKVLENL